MWRVDLAQGAGTPPTSLLWYYNCWCWCCYYYYYYYYYYHYYYHYYYYYYYYYYCYYYYYYCYYNNNTCMYADRPRPTDPPCLKRGFVGETTDVHVVDQHLLQEDVRRRVLREVRHDGLRRRAGVRGPQQQRNIRPIKGDIVDSEVTYRYRTGIHTHTYILYMHVHPPFISRPNTPGTSIISILMYISIVHIYPDTFVLFMPG